MLYEILPNTPRSNYDPRKNPKPHVDGIIVSANAKTTDLVMNRLKYLSLSQPVVGQASISSFTTTHLVDVDSVQSLSNPNGNNNHEGIRRKDEVIIIRVGKIIIINPRMTIIMINQIIMLVRERKKIER
jgi:hypothetical protein